jgi:hypothetical protein
MNRRIPRFLHASADLLAQIKATIAAEPTLPGLRATGCVTLEAEATAANGTKAPRRFQMDAYNGGAMAFWWSDDPVVVDLAGMKISAKARPILKDHRAELVVGHSEKVTIEGGKSLKVTGIASGTGLAAREVVGNSDNGFPWQASIGAEMESVEQVRAGASVTVNGQTFTGPLLVVRASRLTEVSFVALGADDSTAARMVAASSNTTKSTNKGTPVVKNRITLPALLVLAAAYPHLTAALNERAEIADKEDDAAVKGAADLKAWAADQKAPETVEAPAENDAELKASRKQKADEARRCAAIATLCAGKHSAIEAQAIEEGWTAEKAELAVLRASRSSAPIIGGGSRDSVTSKDVLEAAVLQAMKTPEAGMKRFEPKVIEAADKKFRGRLSLQELMLEAAWANGYTGRSFKQDPSGVMRAAFALQAAGFSTIDIGGILSNVANKKILESFMGVDQAWRAISAISPVNDFKTLTSYRMTGAMDYEKVGPGGEIKHGTLGELSYTNRADTYAKMMGLTRQDLINDDLGALGKVAAMLGRGAGTKLNDVFWTAFLDNASFFATGNSNYYADAAAPLSVDSLTVLEQKFADQTDANSKPLGIKPAILLVPSSLNVKASVLMKSAEVRNTTASTKEGTANPHAGKFEVVSTPYLNNASYSGYSAVAWYLLADPRVLSVIETVFLNGQETPTIESADADFSTLGVQLRGYHDFGVAKQEYRAGVKSKGAA